MITAIDTNVLIDLFGADPIHGFPSKEAICSCINQGSLVACEVVWAEVSAVFPSENDAQEALQTLGVQFSSLGIDASLLAGRLWKDYRQKGGRRDRMVADFLIGAHALYHADVLLTRDRGFYRSGMPKLKIIDPST
ncbi:MAG: type II toxin-antitoxin system VapC family toxin [Nitrospirales bacterium]|nr:type II toxin-antitoxin system VapC family toxin [Nitrospirales bacterium]